MKKPPLVSRINRKSRSYSLNQSPLYKVTSKSKFAALLNTPLATLNQLAAAQNNYKLFTIEEEVCPFTGKVTKERPVQEPKRELRKIHERLQNLLRRIETPAYVHGAVKGRSYRSNAVAHKDAERIATFDVRQFYRTTSESRVRDFFVEQMHCVPDVGLLLAKLVCFDGFLPTGSPSSPILSLYANLPMFNELNELAASHGMLFTCYIDDLTFSGSIAPRGLTKRVKAIVEKHGHQLSDKKTRIFRRSQSKHVTGVVISNKQIRVPHSRMQKARAILKAISVQEDIAEKVALNRKLCGLLGEAAFLDPRFANMAKQSYKDLRSLEEEAADTEG